MAGTIPRSGFGVRQAPSPFCCEIPMKINLLLVVSMLALVGCVLRDPLMTGHARDWKGHPSSDLQAIMGVPTRIVPRPNGAEVWEYVQEGEFVAPKEKDTGFSLGGARGFGSFGASGGITTTETGERQSHYRNLWRYGVKNGKITDFYAERSVDGKVVQTER